MQKGSSLRVCSVNESKNGMVRTDSHVLVPQLAYGTKILPDLQGLLIVI